MMTSKGWCLVLSLQEWWDRGVPSPSLSVYTFLALHEIPQRLGMLKAEKWRNDVLEMLRDIPSHCYCCSMHRFCHAIHFRLEYYEVLKNASSELELALWKSKITQHDQLVERKNTITLRTVQRSDLRMNCGATVIIPLVLSFLLSTCACGQCNGYHMDNGDIIFDSDDEFASSSDEDDDIMGFDEMDY